LDTVPGQLGYHSGSAWIPYRASLDTILDQLGYHSGSAWIPYRASLDIMPTAPFVSRCVLYRKNSQYSPGSAALATRRSSARPPACVRSLLQFFLAVLSGGPFSRAQTWRPTQGIELSRLGDDFGSRCAASSLHLFCLGCLNT
jgi:hypothetical protein